MKRKDLVLRGFDPATEFGSGGGGGGGSGTATSVSVVTANGVSGSVATATTTPAITLTLGAITPTTVNGNTITTGTGTLTLAAGKVLTVSSTLTLAGTDSTTMTFPAASGNVVASGGTTAVRTAGYSHGTIATADALNDCMWSPSATTQRALGLQGLASQTAALLAVQNSAGTNIVRLHDAI